MKISILGAGGWGCALAKVLIENGHQVTIWSAIQSEIEQLQQTNQNPEKLKDIILPSGIEYTMEIGDWISDSELVVLATPAKFIRTTSQAFRPYLNSEMILVNVAKGIEDGSLLTMDQVIEQATDRHKIVVLSGPSHAEEVARRIPTSVVVAGRQEDLIECVADAFRNQYFRVYGSLDVIGVEIGGALKNVIALSAGISDGLGFGDNTKAALMTRGMAEITRLGMAMGAEMATFNGLSGIGDLIVTCTSMHSRNRRAGILIGQGHSLEQAVKQVKMVVEGAYSAKAALALADKYQVELPITQQVNRVLFEQASPLLAVEQLMNREWKYETGE